MLSLNTLAQHGFGSVAFRSANPTFQGNFCSSEVGATWGSTLRIAVDAGATRQLQYCIDEEIGRKPIKKRTVRFFKSCAQER